MGKKLYVGNLSYSVTNDSLAEKFAQFGEVTSARVITDRETNRSKGFGFVEMASDADAEAAISSLHGTEFGGRQMNVSEAKPQEARPSNGGGNRGGGFGGGGRNRY